MDNQHRLIRGYRDLDRTSIDAINQLKELERSCLQALASAETYVSTQYNQAQRDHEDAFVQHDLADDDRRKAWKERMDEAGGEVDRLNAAQPHRWLAIARTHMEEGFMAAVRAVAQPVNTGE